MAEADLVAKLQELVSEGQKLRSSYYESVDLPDEQELPPPAPEGAIIELERRLGQSLPDSYRAFLQIHNGWKMGVNGATDLLAVEDVLSGPLSEKIKAWQESARKHAPYVEKALVIGFSKITSTRLLLDFCTRTNPGECAVIQWSADENESFESFGVWLETANRNFTELL